MDLETIQKFYNPKETRYLTHDFHPYPNKFVPQVAKAIIKEYTKENDTILDPFVGSGTSLIEANLLRRNSIGIDLNPLACLISKVKTTSIQINKLKIAIDKLLDDLYFNLKRDGNLKDFIDKIQPNIPEFPKREYWFQENALIELSVLKELINKIEDINIKNFCLVAFSSIIKDVSDASSFYRLTKLKKPKKISRFYVHYKFREKINEMLNALAEYNNVVNSNFIKVYNRDSRYLQDLDKVDFIITNPPNFSLDFLRCFKIYFWWLELGNIKKLDRELIGTKKVNSEIINLNIDFTDNLIEEVKDARKSKIFGTNCVGKRKGIAVALSKYYFDMKNVFSNLYELLKDNRYCCVYASDSILYGNQIRCPDTFVELAKQVGFKLDKRIERIIPKKALIYTKEDKVEEFLILRK